MNAQLIKKNSTVNFNVAEKRYTGFFSVIQFSSYIQVATVCSGIY